MGEIIITDTATVKTSSEELAENANEIKSLAQSISYALNEVRSAWEQSQEDAKSYSDGLQKGAEYLELIESCNRDFANAIQNYMEATEKTGSQTV